MLQGLFSTSEASEFIARCLQSAFTEANAEGFHLNAASGDKIFLHVELGTHHVFFLLTTPLHLEDADPTASTSRLACSIINVLLQVASKTRLTPSRNLALEIPPRHWTLLLTTFFQGTLPFVAAVASPPFRRLPFRRGDTSSLAISSRGHFVASLFVTETLCRQSICRWDTSSARRFVTG